ncbi:phage portal protein [Belliella pelovolcani]|uniref:Phage portal protein, HK97 family n=1 Tax=Belliella pelovolcani TaxID=529505 RepID=A0A1N7MRB7_9BACT|nr:phage portal protein [Belliella pelovolcani]SIS88674.1 phage portal protein, HK97 family [Belliella pelovolcani]
MNISKFFGFGFSKLEFPDIISIDDLGINSNINHQSALSIASFYRGVNIISNTIASLPIKLYKGKETLKNDLYFLLKNKPNNYQSAYEFINTMVMIMLIKGNSFAKINRDERSNIISLTIIEYTSVEAILYNDKLYFKFDDKSPILNDDLLHFKNIGTGYLGIDVVNNFKRNLNININAIDYTNKVYTGEASSIKGSITYDKPLKKEQRDRLRDELQNNFSGKGGKRIIFLEDGMKLDNINLDPSQTRFLESRKFETEEIANMLNLPPFMLMAEKNTSTGVEADNIRFYQTSLLPLITKIEQEINSKLLTKDELLNDVYVKIMVNAILRGDSKSRGEFYKSLFYLGSISPEEIRELEDLPSDIKGDTYIMGNLIPKSIVNRFWDSKARNEYSKAELNESELNEDDDE